MPLEPSLAQLLLLVSLQTADFATTQKIMSTGGRELNPLMESVVGNPTAFAAVKIAPLVGLAMLRKNADKEERKKLAKAMKILNLFMAGAVVNNVIQLSRK